MRFEIVFILWSDLPILSRQAAARSPQTAPIVTRSSRGIVIVASFSVIFTGAWILHVDEQ
jgi:hypothetical protein